MAGVELIYDLRRGDCLALLRDLPDNSIDLVLTDPPYGTTACKWDTVIDLDRMWTELKRVTKPTSPIVMTACQPFTSALVMSNPKQYRHHWVWEKNKASGHLNAKRAPMRAHEDIVVFSSRQPTYRAQMSLGHRPANYAKRVGWSECYGAQVETEYGGATTRYPRSVQQFDIVNNDDPVKVHPTQKPVALMEYLIRTYTDEGATVLDFTMGSGTTGVACLNTGRHFVGIEKDEGYFEIARERIATTPIPDNLWGAWVDFVTAPSISTLAA